MNSLAIKKDFETWKKNSLDSAVNIGDEFLGMSTHIIVSYNKKDNLYNAHSLEFDIVVEGKTEDKVLKGVLEIEHLAILNFVSLRIRIRR